MTKTVIKNVKVKDIPELIARLKLSPEATVNLNNSPVRNRVFGKNPVS